MKKLFLWTFVLTLLCTWAVAGADQTPITPTTSSMAPDADRDAMKAEKEKTVSQTTVRQTNVAVSRAEQVEQPEYSAKDLEKLAALQQEQQIIMDDNSKLAALGARTPGGDLILVEMCPENSIFAQTPYAPEDAWTFATSDINPGYRCYESFSAEGDICDIHWWGLDLSYPWAECEELNPEFEIIFYLDDGQGNPGDPVYTYSPIVPVRTPTGRLFSGFAENRYDLVLDPCINLPSGWVSIQGIGDPEECWFMWNGSLEGNGQSWQWSEVDQTWTNQIFDLSLCLTPEYVPTYGACCDDATGICTDDVEMFQCPPPLRFAANTSCSALDPPCGVILYCDICYTNDIDDWITNVTFNTINNTTGNEGDPCSYGDYTDQSTDVAQYSTHTLSVSFESGTYTEYVRAWIDWNQDAVFNEDASEQYDVGSGQSATVSIDITIPGTALLGPTRMRVAERWNTNPGPCDQATYGEAEDYTVNVLEGQPPNGACCDDATGICTDDVPMDQCPEPLRFAANTLCVDLDPLCGVGPQPPPNDDCENAEAITAPYPSCGEGTCVLATVDCPGVLDWTGVWYTIELPYEINDVNIEVCASDPENDLNWIGIVLMDDCACDDYILRDVGVFFDCPNGLTGYNMDFYAVPGPGTIYWPAWAGDVYEVGIDFTYCVDVTEVSTEPCPEDSIVVVILTDTWGYETSWEIADANTGEIICSVPPETYGNNTLYTEVCCIPYDGCYDFTIYDDYGDGIFPPGYYEVYLNETLVGSNYNFDTDQETVEDIGNGCGPAMGACCIDLVCEFTSEEQPCLDAGGDWYYGETCPEFECPLPPIGGCCYEAGLACSDNTEEECVGLAGTWNPNARCDDPDFPSPVCDQELCSYDNGLPLDEYGSPASQYAFDYPFAAGAADDFIMAGEGECELTNVLVWTSHWNGAEGQGPNLYTGINVTVYANNDPDGPGGYLGDDDVRIEYFEGGVVATQLVDIGEVTFSQLSPVCTIDDWEVSIPISMMVPRGEKLWLEVQPIMPFAGGGQSAIRLSQSSNGLSAQQIFLLLELPWTEIAGNSTWDCDDTSPLVGTRPDLAFILTGTGGEPPCVYIPGDCNHNDVALELADVIAMIGMYRGTVTPAYTCDCPPHGATFAPEADPNGNCVALELGDVVTEIAAYRGTGTAYGCVDCPGDGPPPPLLGKEGTSVVPSLKSKVKTTQQGSAD